MKTQFGRFTFNMPPGFTLLAEGSVAAAAGCSVASLARQAGPDCGGLGQKSDPRHFPTQLHLTELCAAICGSPKIYLQTVEEQLRAYMPRSRARFIKEDRLGKYSAACAQFSYGLGFPIEHLCYVWQAEAQMQIATLLATPPQVEEGWLILRSFASSVNS